MGMAPQLHEAWHQGASVSSRRTVNSPLSPFRGTTSGWRSEARGERWEVTRDRVLVITLRCCSNAKPSRHGQLPPISFQGKNVGMAK
jgi:hypothetical protein